MDQRNPSRPRPFSRPVSRIATRPDVVTALRSLIGGFVGIGIVAGLAQHGLADTDLTLMIGAFGATAVLPVGLGALALLLVALVVNNIGVTQRWPQFRP